MAVIYDVEQAFQVLFQVWDGTENADLVLQDACRTIGHRVLALEGEALNAFEEKCRGTGN